jgi:uncharacterized membrane protein
MRIVGGIAIAVGLAASTTLIKSARPARSLSSAVNASPPRVDTSFWGDEPIPASTSARRSVVDRDNGGFFDPGLAFAERPAGPTPTRSRVNPDDGNEPSRRRVVTARRAASSTAVADRDGAAVIPTADIDHGEMCRWRADRASWLAFAGVAVAVVSFWFDGHTVTKGFRPLHAVANSVHVVAGSVWVGGVVAMAVVLWSRYRHSRPTDALGLVVRFSSVASVALAAVVVAGVIMAIAVLDSFGELTSTQWGQTLLLKSAAASIAIAAGAYNHFRLMPALERRPDDVELHTHVRSTVTAEAIVLGFVVVVTAWLVAAAS